MKNGKALLLSTYAPSQSLMPAYAKTGGTSAWPVNKKGDKAVKNHQDLTAWTNSHTNTPTVGAIYEAIEAELERAEACFRRGAKESGARYLREAWAIYTRFADILNVYAGPDDDLRERLMEAWTDQSIDDVPPLPIEETESTENVPTLAVAAMVV